MGKKNKNKKGRRHTQQPASQPSPVLNYLEQAKKMQMTGNLSAALELSDMAISARQALADAHFTKGNILQMLKRYGEALACFDRTIEIDPHFAEAHNTRAEALEALGNFAEALTAYDRAITLHPGYAAAHNNRGIVLQQLGRHDEALEAFNQAVSSRSDFAEAYANSGLILMQLGKTNEALLAYEQALKIRPDFAAAHANLGMLLDKLGKPEEALVCFDEAIALNRYFAEAHHNKGIIFMKLKRYSEALDAFAKTVALQPNFTDAYYNRGFILHTLTRYDEALACYNRAIAINPRHILSHWNKSLLLLLQGNYAQGWPLYEWRWRLESYQPFIRRLSQPSWSGQENIRGKTILIYREQGFGDTIQMLRYAPLLVQRGAKVIVSANAALLPLISMMEGTLCLVDKQESLPEFDLQCPMMSLPLAFQTTLQTIPNTVPYLKAPENKIIQWRLRLGEKTMPRIGLAWSGVSAYKQDRERSVALSTLLPLLERKAEFHSLQIEYRTEDKEIMGKDGRIHDHAGEIRDFGDTAALIGEMDLVISVDTAVAHLAGALGKPVWILLPYAPDFRWLLNREDSPWYPTARLFRQPVLHSWDRVVERLMSEKI